VEGTGIVEYYCGRYGRAPDQILAGNGATELIYLIPPALGLKRVLVLGPTFHDYARASRLAGAAVDDVSLSAEDRFCSFDPGELKERLSRADGLWLCNPNNPTGTVFHKDMIFEIADAFPEKWVIVDEAFMPFVEEAGSYSLLLSPPVQNILVLHSLTKFYGLAGLRLGGVLGHESVIARLKQYKAPWSVSRLAERIAPLLLDCDAYEHETRRLIRRGREDIFRSLQRVQGLVSFPAHANYILCRWRATDDLDDLLRHLLQNGLFVRDCRNFKGLEENYFRMAVRTSRENEKLIAGILSACQPL
jgi:threonine-phosphate decarboxylase